ncbi:MAG: GNAT family N-acetyltransferase [Eubacteriales bacterium]
MKDNIHISQLTIYDIPYLTQLMNNRQIQQAIHIGDTDEAHWLHAFNNIWSADKDEENYIIRYEDAEVGWLKLNGFDHKEIAWISMLVIDPEYQKMGIGSYVVNSACELIRKRGFKSVGIHTNKENTAAHRCYEKCGFTVTEIGDCTNSDGFGRIGYTFEKPFYTDELEQIKSYWLANLYDKQETQTDDVEMLLSFLGEEPKKVFEVCCKSGRILVPIAKAGHYAVGLDINNEMIAMIPDKAKEIDNLRFYKADAVKADWGHDFDVAVLAGNILINIVSDMDYREAQRLFIKKAMECLKNEGYLFLDFNLFLHPEKFFGVPLERIIFEGTDDRGVYGKYTVLGGTYDSVTQICDGKNRTELSLPDSTQKIIYGVSRKHIPTLADIHNWLVESCFEIVKEYGDYNKNPVSDNTGRAIIWARKCKLS